MILVRLKKGVFIRFKVRHEEDDFKFNLISIYGPAQNDLKSYFLSEVV